MEIHKPKPWNGVREFLKEYLIIVVGVLTALAGEQFVETLHWRHEVAEVRLALGRELATNAALIKQGLDDGACIDQLLGALSLWARGQSGTNAFTELRAPVLAPYFSSVWDAALAGQVAAHIPTSERLAYASVYGDLNDLRQVIANERQIWTNLAGFSEKKQLTDEERRRLGEEVARARVLNRIWRSSAVLALGGMKQVGVDVANAPPAVHAGSCRTHNAFGVLR